MADCSNHPPDVDQTKGTGFRSCSSLTRLRDNHRRPIAGTLDLTQACILFGWDIPLSIAAGLLGPQAIHGLTGISSPAIYILGVFLHFFVAFTATTNYYAASRKLILLTGYPLICGLFFGAAVEEVMSLIVLPLSALHAKGPYDYQDLIQGLAAHMIIFGLPVAYSVRRFGTTLQAGGRQAAALPAVPPAQ